MAGERISPARFAFVFERFKDAVATHPKSPGAFTDFQSGLAGKWENYKDWLYLEARRRLNASAWKKSSIGSGQILQRVIDAIQIREDQDHRNNIVEWEQKYRAEDRSHHRLLLTKKSLDLREPAEEALFRFYANESNPEESFAELVKHFGGRYDLISYLFFIRDWNRFLPVRPTYFSKAFEMLGVSLKMRNKCCWANYVEFLTRIRQVQELLVGYEIPNGVRFIDAHSFCWMLASPEINVRLESSSALTVAFQPLAGAAPSATSAGQQTFTQSELDQLLRRQRQIGDLAQAIVIKAERDRLTKQGFANLAQQVKDVSDDVSLGYDIASFTSDGAPKLIEVKAAARRGNDLRFFLSENQRARARLGGERVFALVLDMQSEEPIIAEFFAKDLPQDSMHPITYEVRLRNPPASLLKRASESADTI